MGILKLNEGADRFYNKESIFHIVLIFIISISVNVSFIFYWKFENYYSAIFYSHLAMVILYLIGSKERGGNAGIKSDIEASFHFSIFTLASSLVTLDLFVVQNRPSAYVGIFMMFGTLSLFNLVVELIRSLKRHEEGIKELHNFIELIAKLFLFSFFCLALFLITTGEWRWDVVSIFDW